MSPAWLLRFLHFRRASGFAARRRGTASRRLRLGRRFFRQMQTQNLHASDAAAVHFSDRKAEAGVLEAFPAARDEAEPAQNEPADGRVAGVFRQADAVLRV